MESDKQNYATMDKEKRCSSLSESELEYPGEPPFRDDDVVITGMSSIMPDCQDFKEFAEKLYKKKNMVTQHNRWKYSHPELPPYLGQVSDIERFDPQFFMINSHTIQSSDPGLRKILEQAHRALFDAGFNPEDVSRKRIGVFIALSQLEIENIFLKYGLALLGISRAMYANRISYWLNVTGPSYTIDSASAGSTVALEKAYEAIKSGQCEAALVGGIRMILHPMPLIHFDRTVPQNLDGKSKCFDISADGPSLSESISMLFLQKYKDSRRVYAQVCHVKTEFSQSDSECITKAKYNRDPEILAKFLSNFYKDAGVSPSSVEYVEGFGAASLEADKSELQAIEKVFCKDRSGPLLVGSVVSNIGFTEVVSGLNGVIKVLHGYKTGVLAANLNCDNPRQDIAAIRDGRIKIVTEHHPFGRSYAAVNSFSLNGINGHVLLRGYITNKDKSKYTTDLPYLVTISGCDESGVEKVLKSIKSDDLDPEKLALLRKVYRASTPNHLARGFGVFTSENQMTVTLRENVRSYNEAKRPLWFVYSGMGSHWTGMGTRLMRLPVFAAAIYRCDEILKPKGIDLVYIITTEDKTIFNNILYAFVGITAIQLALTDVLRAVGLVPDKIIGHSVGELACAYADDCLTLEETILLAYSRGLVSVQMPFIKGAMAAVGLRYTEVSKLCPPEIEVACHNGPDSSTLSGPVEMVQTFVKELTDQGIFAKEVKCANIAYHSRYIATAGPVFLKMGQAIVKTPKLRSQKWLSTSVPMDKWKQYDAMYSSAEYHTNNLLNPVLFEETSRMIPNKAVLIEIAPHGLLQAILKRSLPECINVPLTNRAHSDSIICLLEALGNLYMEGCDIDTTALYPKVEFPVSIKTAQLSHLVSYRHSERWNFNVYCPPDRQLACIYKPIVSLHSEEYNFLKGCVIEGKIQFPLAGVLMFVWDTLAMTIGKKQKSISVKFQNIIFYDHPILEEDSPLEFTIMVQHQSGRFEVLKDPNHLIVDGQIEVIKPRNIADFPGTDEILQLTSSDVYKLLYERGFEYTGDLRSIHRANISLTKAEIAWNGNWTTFLDGILQLITLRHDHDGISQPSCIKEIVIDVDKHLEAVLNDKTAKGNNHETVVEATFDNILNKIKSGGVLVTTLILKDKPVCPKLDINYKSLKFVPFIQEYLNVSTNLYVALQIVSEHFGISCIKVLTINDNPRTDHLHRIRHLLSSEPKIQLDITEFNEVDVMNKIHKIEKPDLVLINNQINNKQLFKQLHRGLSGDTFLLIFTVDTKHIDPKLFKSIFVAGKNDSKLELFKWLLPQNLESIVCPVKNFSDLERLQNLRKDLSTKTSLTVVSSYPPISGVKEMVTNLRKEDFQAHLTMINSGSTEKPELDLKKLHNMDLAFSVLEHGRWGGQYYVPLAEIRSKPENMTLQIDKPGDLTSLQWVESYKNSKQGIPIAVHYAGLNIHDAKRASGVVSSKTNTCFGMDFSGLNERNEPVMGLVSGGTVSNIINVESGLLWPVPEHWCLEDAATVPLPYCMAFYCLYIRLGLTPGMKILVHGGAGALGQAVISIALAHKCTVFTTVSDVAKKRFLRKLFPDLPANNIGNSRDETFSDMVRGQTKDAGCEIIISNVKGNLKNATLSCTSNFGTVLDVVQIPDRDNYTSRLAFMTKGRSYSLADFSSVFNNDNESDLQKLQWMVSEGIAQGYVRPLSRVVYETHEVPRAFRLLAASRHRGRVLVRMQHQQLARPRISCLPDSSYLIMCDKEGLGIKLVDKLIKSGAKTIHLHLSSQLPHLLYKKTIWKNAGVQVIVSDEQIDDGNNLVHLLEDLNTNRPIDGFFAILDDPSDFDASTLIKLDDSTRKLCPSMRYFMILNGQKMAQHMCQKRFQDGFPAVSINISVNKFNRNQDAKSGFDWLSAVDVIDVAAKIMEYNILFYAKDEAIDIQEDIIEEIRKIPGVSIPSAMVVDRTSLEKVGIDDGRSYEFCNMLEKKFDIKIPHSSVPYLTIGQLKKLQLDKNTLKEERSGIKAYFPCTILPDVLLANTNLVQMPTLLVKANMRSDEFKIEDSHMFIIPGFEGHHDKFKHLCGQLKIATAVLQPGYHNHTETIQEMALRFSNVIIYKLKYKTHFYLLGYEFGVFVALEIAAILENYGLSGTVFCLGGSPEEIRSDIENRLEGIRESKLQNELIQHVCSLASGDTTHVYLELKHLDDFDDKVQMCAKKSRGRILFNTDYMTDVLKSIYSRIGFVRSYKSDPLPLISKVIFIRTLPPISSSLNTAHYELPVSITYAPDHLGCPAIINKHLEPNVLEDFAKRNLCESYLKNNEHGFMKFGLLDE